MNWQRAKGLFSWYRRGIRRRLLLWGLTLLGLALIINTLAGSFYTRRQIKTSAAQLQAEVASMLARRISAFMNRKVERLGDAAVSMSLYPLGGDGQRLLANLLLKNDRAFTEIALLDEKGMEVLKLSERRVYLSAELSDQSESEKFQTAGKGKNYISPVYTSDKAEPYVTVAVPVRLTPRQIIGVVSAEANLKSLWELIGQVEFGRAGYAYVVDGRGNLIAHKDSSLVLKRTNLSRLTEIQEFLRDPTGVDLTPANENIGITGKPVLSSHAPLPGLSWAIVLEEPVDAALAGLRRMERYALLLLGVGLLVGALVIVWVSNKMTEPIRQLHRGAEIIGRGDLDHRVEIKSGDEIEELARGFNIMAADLKVSYATLEQKVEDRTRELSALYDVTATVNQSLEIEPVLQEVIRKITDIFHFDATRVFLFNPEGNELHLRASFESHPEAFYQVGPFRRGQGIIGKVAETGEPLIFEDAPSDPRYQELSVTKATQKAGLSFFAVFPIKTKVRVFGVILFIGRSPRRLTADEMKLLSSMSDQIGVAVQNANLFQETVTRAKELSALYDVTATVNQSLDLDLVLRDVSQKVLDVTYFDAARIYLLDPEAKELRLKAYQGISEKFAAETGTDPIGVGINGYVAETGIPMIFDDIQGDPRYAQVARGKAAQKAGFHAYVSLPLKTKAKTVGVINFLSYQVHRLLPKDIALFTSIANQVGVAVENASLFEETTKRAEEISALYTVTTTVNQSLDLDRVLQEVIEKITEIFHFDTMRVFLFDRETDELRLTVSFPADREDAPRIRVFRRGQGIVGRAAETGEAMIFDDIQSDPRYWELSHTQNQRTTGFRFFSAFPIRTKLMSVGAIVCSGKAPRRLTHDEIQLIVSMTNQIGVAVENASLFCETKEKSLELEKANIELVEANRAKADFMAAMSHELRTPLNVIIGNADLVRDGYFGDVSEKQKDSLEKILYYSDALLKLINNVLTLSKIEAGKMSLHLSTVSVDEIISHSRSYVEQLNRNGRLEILWKVEPDLTPITTDALKLEEILQNLIGNAFKFTSRGKIEVRIRDLPGKDRIEFAVADTGIGIPKSEVEKIFEQFYQLQDAHTGNYSGVGLGLNIVKNYLGLMHGEIRVESQPGTGSTFTFTLPYSISSTSDKKEAMASSSILSS